MYTTRVTHAVNICYPTYLTWVHRNALIHCNLASLNVKPRKCNPLGLNHSSKTASYSLWDANYESLAWYSLRGKEFLKYNKCTGMFLVCSRHYLRFTKTYNYYLSARAHNHMLVFSEAKINAPTCSFHAALFHYNSSFLSNMVHLQISYLFCKYSIL